MYIGIISGLISGLISSWLITCHYRREDKKLQRSRQLYDARYRYCEYLREIIYELDVICGSLNEEKKASALERLKKLVGISPIFDAFSNTSDINKEFLDTIVKINVFLMDFNNELIQGIKRETQPNYFLKKKSQLYRYFLEILKIPVGRK